MPVVKSMVQVSEREEHVVSVKGNIRFSNVIQRLLSFCKVLSEYKVKVYGLNSVFVSIILSGHGDMDKALLSSKEVKQSLLFLAEMNVKV